MSIENRRENRRSAGLSAFVMPGVLTVMAVLTVVAFFSIRHMRLQDTIASNGQETSATALGLSAQGFDQQASKGSVADIAASLVVKAFSFTPEDFDATVAAARNTMTSSMQKAYDDQLKDQKTRKLVVKDGLNLTMSVVHEGGKSTNPALMGVVSLTSNRGEFEILFQASSTTAGSKKAQIQPYLFDVTVEKIGSTWKLSRID